MSRSRNNSPNNSESVQSVVSAIAAKPRKSELLHSTILVGCLGIFVLSSLPANAQTVQLGDFAVTLQSTLGYTLGVRTAPVDNAMASLNNDDGDRNFKSGIMENRIQTLEQLSISDGNYGFRASALAFLDAAYLQHSGNNSPNTFNSFGIGPQGFPSGTVANEGRRFEPLAAFFYGAEYFDNGNQKLSWQVGRQTITWGESLFSLDGISGLQAPVDTYQAQSLPNPEAQALFLPTGAASVTYDFGNGISVDGYWQFEYEPDSIAGVGSYFSDSDEIGPGAQRILVSPINEGALSLFRAPDVRPSNGLDQFGFAAHDSLGNYEVGAYFVRGIPKSPTLYTTAFNPSSFVPTPNGLQVGKYNIVYAQPVNAFAVSASTLFMSANVAGELSGRTNQPLVSDATASVATPASYNHPLYAIGDVLDAQLSALYVTKPLLPVFANGISIETELTLNKVLSVTQNKAALLPGNTSEGGSFEAVFTPNWFPRADIEIETPVGWTTTFLGDSEYDGSAAGVSTIDVGAEAIYETNLTLGVNYQRYAGPPNRQANLDRDFVTLYVQRVF
jgi:hypothetical protein